MVEYFGRYEPMELKEHFYDTRGQFLGGPAAALACFRD